MIFANALPHIKTFLRPARLREATTALVVRLIAAFLNHPGRLSAAAAAAAVRAEARHRAQLTRFLARCRWSQDWAVLAACADLLLRHQARTAGTWVFILDPTYVGPQGRLSENTFHCGHRRRRPRKGRRYQKRKHARRSGHGFVMGLLLSPCGLRMPSCRCYYTQDYCPAQKRPYRTQLELAAELIQALAVPEQAEVVVLGDTAFEAQGIRAACVARGFGWVVPVNPARVLAGAKPRPKVRLLAEGLSPHDYQAVRLLPGPGAYALQQRAAHCRLGPHAHGRTFWVHAEKRAVHHVGDVLLVFSTKEQPQLGQAVVAPKVLRSDGVGRTAAAVVERYALRWQGELFFTELKSTLGLHHYRFRRFAAVEGWVQACLVTFCYLEWFRALHLRREGLPEKAKSWWRWQRCYGLSRAVVQRAEEHDLAQLLRWSGTKSGLRKLRRSLRQALPLEYRPTG